MTGSDSWNNRSRQEVAHTATIRISARVQAKVPGLAAACSETRCCMPHEALNQLERCDSALYDHTLCKPCDELVQCKGCSSINKLEGLCLRRSETIIQGAPRLHTQPLCALVQRNCLPEHKQMHQIHSCTVVPLHHQCPPPRSSLKCNRLATQTSSCTYTKALSLCQYTCSESLPVCISAGHLNMRNGCLTAVPTTRPYHTQQLNSLPMPLL